MLYDVKRVEWKKDKKSREMDEAASKEPGRIPYRGLCSPKPTDHFLMRPKFGSLSASSPMPKDLVEAAQHSAPWPFLDGLN